MTSIEWVKNPDNIGQGITVNSKSGCDNHTPEGLCLGGLFPCYAFRLANGRLKQRYLANGHLHTLPLAEIQAKGFEYTDIHKAMIDPFYPRWWPERLDKIRGLKKPTGIFLDDMSDWMGDYWPEEWTRQEIQVMRDCPQHRFYTLTKQPQNLPQFSSFPDNCFVGVTATNDRMLANGIESLRSIEATVKFISLEPLLSWNTPFDYLVWESLWRAHINWLIIGACTGSSWEMIKLGEKLGRDDMQVSVRRFSSKWTLQPRIEWVREIVEAADKAGVKVFLKDNLKPLLEKNDMHKYEELWQHKSPRVREFPLRIRQELPK